MPENLHLTLAFLGECDELGAKAAKAAMDEVKVDPFRVEIEKLGCFRRRGGDIWWAGVRKDRKLMGIQKDLSRCLEKQGFDLEERPYSPHITLGREVITAAKPGVTAPFGMTARIIDLMKSERIKGKLTYTSVYRRGKWKDPIQVVPHDPGWKKEFERIRDFLLPRIGDLAVEIHHVGSTGVPGLWAKPIIDLDVEIRSMDGFPEMCERLKSLGYHHEGDYGISGREAFKIRGKACPEVRGFMKHHMYVCPSGSLELARHLAFRDYLRENIGACEEYGRLKRHLAQVHGNDIDAYIKGKAQFIEKALYLKANSPNQP